MYNHKIEYSSPEGDTLYCEVDYECKFGSPGNLSGPREHCYPPERHEIKIVAIRPTSDLDKQIIDSLIERISKLPGGTEALKAFWAPIIAWIEENCYEELCRVAEEQAQSRAFDDALDELLGDE